MAKVAKVPQNDICALIKFGKDKTHQILYHMPESHQTRAIPRVTIAVRSLATVSPHHRLGCHMQGFIMEVILWFLSLLRLSWVSLLFYLNSSSLSKSLLSFFDLVV